MCGSHTPSVTVVTVAAPAPADNVGHATDRGSRREQGVRGLLRRRPLVLRRAVPAHRGALPLALAPVPEGWRSHRSGDWLALRPDDAELPAQGWKIHISACLDNAESVLRRVHAYCLERRIAFKFVPGRHLLHLRNAKYADRAASGKFLTLYPADEAQCGQMAEELDALLAA